MKLYSGIKVGICLVILVLFAKCNPEKLDPDPDALPRFSADTVTFDTIFTSIGSATLSFKVYNRSNRPLIINSIDLAGGDDSFFRLNIDGEAVSHVNHVEVPPDDSLFVFVAVTINPNNANNPLIVKDSVVFITNGTVQDVKLIAYGQDVHLINGEILQTQTWNGDKPYLIYNSMSIDTGQTLTIQAGSQIYFHSSSSLIVWGTIQVEGTRDNPVVFQNDRSEEFYDIIAGQWGTIYIDPISRGNAINYAVIKNAITGIQIGYPSDFHVPDLVLSNCQIINVSYANIYAFGAELTCYNSVFTNSAGPVLAFLRGGRYAVYHCTISNKGVAGASRSDPAVILTNTFLNTELNEGSGQYEYVRRSGDLIQADFVNCILYGNLNHELQLSDNHSNLFQYQFDHCLMKAIEDSIDGNVAGHFTSLILNKDPFFMNDSDRYHLDYNLDTLSPAKDAGSPLLLISHPYLNTDFNGFLRNEDANPDLGAFERKED
jgi:hypothetical protein